MGELNALTLICRHDGSYFYLVELGWTKGLYKYLICDWDKAKLAKPILIFSHTKRSKLTKPLKEFFDNNLLNSKRLKKYLDEKNCYIGGIDVFQNQTFREFKEGVKIYPKYQVYERNGNNILVEQIDYLNNLKLYVYMIYEFTKNKDILDFSEEKIYSEKNLLDLEKDEKDYVINHLLSKERVTEKVNHRHGYVGTIEKINGNFRKKFYADKETQIQNYLTK